jgi:hypothetical protein
VSAVLFAIAPVSATVGLIIIFGGIGLLANGLIVYAIAQALGERSEKLPPKTDVTLGQERRTPPPGQRV